jgi:predicted negative regulator of RcsB-dependent stress response
MIPNSKNKVIQVQKPAQSLQAFQKKVASGDDLQTGLLKPMLIGAGVAVGLGVAFFGFRAWRASVVEKHESALASLQLEVTGDAVEPAPAAEVEKRMRAKLPELEALARNAPGSKRETTEGILASWKLQLDGTGGIAAQQNDAWDKLRLAQKQLALGQGAEALATLGGLRKEADPGKAWAPIFWTTLLDIDRLKGDRSQALKDFADYKARFKTQADPAVERLLQGV